MLKLTDGICLFCRNPASMTVIRLLHQIRNQCLSESSGLTALKNLGSPSIQEIALVSSPDGFVSEFQTNAGSISGMNYDREVTAFTNQSRCHKRNP